MFLLIAGAGLAWGFARVLEAPRWVERLIPLAALIIMAATLLLLPADHSFRQSIAGSVQSLVILGLVAIPLAAYALLIRRVRRRTIPKRADTAPITGQIVRIEDDGALRRDYQLDQRAPGFSLMRRDAEGSPDLVALVDQEGPRLLVTLPLVGFDGVGDLPGVLRDVCREEGARQIVVTSDASSALEPFLTDGYHEAGRVRLAGAPDRVTLTWTAP